MAALEVVPAVSGLYGCELAAQDLLEEGTLTTGRLRLILDQVEHVVHHPCRGEDLAVVGHALPGLD